MEVEIMGRMQRESVDFEELEELAAQVNFKLECDDDYIRLFREARKLGWWPEMDRPKMDTKHFWAPPADSIRYRPNPFPDPGLPKQHKKKSAAAQQKELAVAELEKVMRQIRELEKDPRTKDLVEKPLEGVQNLDKWLDDIH